MQAEIRIRVRYGETDQMGAAWHGHHLAWFEMARTELMRELGTPYAEVERGGHRFVVIDARVRYHSPALYDEELWVRAQVAWTGPARVRFTYGVRGSDGRAIASGETTLACTDMRGRVCRIPPPLAGRLAEAAAPARPDKGATFRPEDR